MSEKNYADLTDEDLIKLYNKQIPKDLQHGVYKSKGFVFTELFANIEQEIDEFEVFDDDIWISSYPKSGTTWLSEMIWSICNDLKTPEAKQPLESRVRFIEYSCLYKFPDSDTKMHYVNNSVQLVKEMQRPRFIKTHLPWPLLPRAMRTFQKRPRIIHVARNPKDVAVSYYHHHKAFRGYTGDAELFYELFIRDLVRWSPYMDNIHSFWHHKDEANLLFIKYEDMKKDTENAIRQIALFLNFELSDNKMQQLLEHLSFANMKNNEDLQLDGIIKYIGEKYLHDAKCGKQESKFFRKGETGAHRNEMCPSTVCKYDKWIEEKTIYGLKF